MSAWATPVGATTQAEFRPEAMAVEEQQPGSASVSRPVMWGIVLLIGATLAAAGIWLERHFNTERELAALARVAAIPGAESPAAELTAPDVRRPATPPLPAVPAGSSVTAQGAPSDRTSPDRVPSGGTTSSAVNDRTVADRAAADRTPAGAPPADPRTVAAVTAGEPATPPASAAPFADQVPPAEPIAAAPVSPARSQPIARKPTAAPATKRQPSAADSERAMAKLSPKAREYLYSRAFRRCPSPGLPGALQCRKHICNGAEGRTPACYHINRLNL